MSELEEDGLRDVRYEEEEEGCVLQGQHGLVWCEERWPGREEGRREEEEEEEEEDAARWDHSINHATRGAARPSC